jgi:hypothetical protein
LPRCEAVPLTRLEFDLLAVLAERPGAAVTRRNLVERVLDADPGRCQQRGEAGGRRYELLSAVAAGNRAGKLLCDLQRGAERVHGPVRLDHACASGKRDPAFDQIVNGIAQGNAGVARTPSQFRFSFSRIAVPEVLGHFQADFVDGWLGSDGT